MDLPRQSFNCLIATLFKPNSIRGILIPLAFVIATGIGAGIHLASINLPIPEIIIAASVVLFGVLLAFKRSQKNLDYGLKITALAALAGIFHGYAYGEGIFGAEPTPMIAYLIGFIIIQLAIALGTHFISVRAIKSIPAKYLTMFAGSAIASCGIVFLSSAIMNWMDLVKSVCYFSLPTKISPLLS